MLARNRQGNRWQQIHQLIRAGAPNNVVRAAINQAGRYYGPIRRFVRHNPRRSAAGGLAAAAGAAYRGARALAVRGPRNQRKLNQSLNIRTPTYVSSKKRRRRKYSRKFMAKRRRFARAVRRVQRKWDIEGRLLKHCTLNSFVIGSSENSCNYFETRCGASSFLEGFMDDDYVELGKNDANNVQREEIYNLLGGKTQFKLLHQLEHVLHIKNNYNYAVRVMLMSLEPKEQTNTAPILDIHAGLDDIEKGGGTTFRTSPCWYPSDSKIFNQNWNVRRTHKFVMYPGEHQSFRRKMRWRLYDPENHDQHTFANNPKQTHYWVMRIVGTVSHNAVGEGVTPGNVGYSATNLDLVEECKVKYKHVGQKQIQRHSTSNNLDALVVRQMNARGVLDADNA